MKLRQLGADGPRVSAVGYGAMVLSPGVYGGVDDEESVRTLHFALDAGITFLDTARLYGAGHNEELVGRAIAGRREQVVLATKGGLTGTPPELKVDGSPAGLRADLEASLRALDTDHVDLYYLHTPDPVVPVEESIAAMADFVTEGKVRYLGVSNFDLDQLRRAQAIHPITASQDQYSLFYRVPEQQAGSNSSTSSASPWWRTARWETACSPARVLARRRGTCAAGCPVSRVPKATGSPVSALGSAPSPSASMSHRPRWPWPGCSTVTRTWFPSPAPGAPAT
jgi:hypothetical protein